MSEKIQAALAEKITLFMERLMQAARQPALEEWATNDLTMAQLRTLGLLHDGPRRMSDLASFLGIGLPSATSVVTRLESKQLVERIHDPSDRRVVTCRLTPRGQEQIEALWRVHVMSVTSLVEHMTEEEREAVLRAMDILIASAERMQAVEPVDKEG